MPYCDSMDTGVVKAHQMRCPRLRWRRFGRTVPMGFLPNPPRLCGRLLDGRFSCLRLLHLLDLLFQLFLRPHELAVRGQRAPREQGRVALDALVVDASRPDAVVVAKGNLCQLDRRQDLLFRHHTLHDLRLQRRHQG